LGTWAQDGTNEKTKVIAKTDEMELVRLVLPAGKDFPMSNSVKNFPVFAKRAFKFFQ
jgi:hypothetical protein